MCGKKPCTCKKVPGFIDKFVIRHGIKPLLEKKCLDNIFNGTAATTYSPDGSPNFTPLPLNNNNSNIQCLNLVQQGPGISQRIGHQIKMKSIELNLGYYIQSNVASGVINMNSKFRLIVYYDRNPNGVYSVSTDILSQQPATGNQTGGTLFSMLNPYFFDRILILEDKIINLAPFNAISFTSIDTFGPNNYENYVYRKKKLNYIIYLQFMVITAMENNQIIL